eukprot:10482866-Alexandrium_andersonii.AAC.1
MPGMGTGPGMRECVVRARVHTGCVNVICFPFVAAWAEGSRSVWPEGPPCSPRAGARDLT